MHLAVDFFVSILAVVDLLDFEFLRLIVVVYFLVLAFLFVVAVVCFLGFVPCCLIFVHILVVVLLRIVIQNTRDG